MKKTKCKRCKHEWFARVENVKTCPRCKNYLPREEEKK